MKFVNVLLKNSERCFKADPDVCGTVNLGDTVVVNTRHGYMIGTVLNSDVKTNDLPVPLSEIENMKYVVCVIDVDRFEEKMKQVKKSKRLLMLEKAILEYCGENAPEASKTLDEYKATLLDEDDDESEWDKNIEKDDSDDSDNASDDAEDTDDAADDADDEEDDEEDKVDDIPLPQFPKDLL